MATKQATAYKDKGNEAFKAGDHAKAIELYTFATELDPNNPIFFTNRSNAYYMMKNYAKSERDARKAIANQANWEKGHYRLGMALQAQGMHKEALESFKEAVSLDPNNATFKNAVVGAKAAMMKGMTKAAILKTEGNEQFKNGQIELAVETYTRALSLISSDPKDQQIKVDCLANRAACNRQLYLPDQCVEDCSEALTIDPHNQKCLIRRAQAYESLEKYQKAADDFFVCWRLNNGAKAAMDGVSRLRKQGIQPSDDATALANKLIYSKPAPAAAQ